MKLDSEVFACLVESCMGGVGDNPIVIVIGISVVYDS